MGMPTSLAGILGFIIFIVFILVLVVPSVNTQDAQNIQSAQNTFVDHLNQTVNANNSGTPTQEGWFSFFANAVGIGGIYDFIIGFFQTILSFIQLAFNYLAAFLHISSTIPTPFYVMFVILGASLIVAVVKLIFLNGE